MIIVVGFLGIDLIDLDNFVDGFFYYFFVIYCCEVLVYWYWLIEYILDGEGFWLVVIYVEIFEVLCDLVIYLLVIGG